MNEHQTLNEDSKIFYIAGKKYEHKLLNYYYYNVFVDRLNVVLMKVHSLFTKEEPFLSRNPLEFNKQAWHDRLSDIRLIEIFYDLFILAFYNKKFHYEDIFITDSNGRSNIFSYFIVKPILFILDKIHIIKTGRINFKKFIKSLDKVQMLDLFINIMKTQVDIDIKKKIFAMLQGAEDQYLQVSQLFTSGQSPDNGKKDNMVPFPYLTKEGFTELFDPTTTELPSENGS